MAVPPPSSAPDKAKLRVRLRSDRAAFVAVLGEAGIAEAARAMVARVAPLLAGAVGGYVAHRGEPDMLAAMLAAHHLGHALALPRVTDGAIRFVMWRPEMALAPGFAGIHEPTGDAETIPDTLLVPLIGFDRARRRLGQGAGCYDRWLAAHRGVRTIGVAWSIQEVDAIPTDPWDRTLDVIVTEAETIAP